MKIVRVLLVLLFLKYSTSSILSMQNNLNKLSKDNLSLNQFVKSKNSFSNSLKQTIQPMKQFSYQSEQGFQKSQKQSSLFDKKALFLNQKKKNRKLDDTIDLEKLSEYVDSINSQNPIVLVNTINTNSTISSNTTTTNSISNITETTNSTIENHQKAENCTIYPNGTYQIKEEYYNTNSTTNINSLTQYNDFSDCEIIQEQDPDIYYVKHPLVYDPNDKFGMQKLSIQQGTKMNIYDINTLLYTIGRLQETFDTLYEFLPTSTKEQDDALKKITDNSKTQGTLTTTLNLLKFYAKIRKFLINVLDKREDLIKETNYVGSKLNSMSFSRSDMIVFYDQNDKYQKVQLRIVSNRRDKRLQDLDDDLNQITERFSDYGSGLLSGFSTLAQYIANFLEIIFELQSAENNYSALQILATIDQIIEQTIKLLENKLEIQNAITKIKTGFSAVNQIKFELNETLQNIIDFKEDRLWRIPKTSWIFSVWKIFMIFLLMN